MLSKPLSLKPYLIIALLIFLLAFGLRMVDLGVTSLWLDESFTAESMMIARDGDGFVASVKARLLHVPIYFASLLLYPDEHSDFSMRYPSVLWSLLLIAMTMRILTHIYHFRRYALFAGFLLAVHSLVIIQSREARMYPMTNFLVATSTYFFLRYLQQSTQANRHWVLAIVFTLIAYLTHIATFLLIPAQGAVLLWQVIRRKMPARNFFGWGAIQAILVIPTLLWMTITVFDFDAHNWVEPPNPELIRFVAGQLVYGHLDLVGVGFERGIFLAVFPILILIPAVRTRYLSYWLGMTWLTFIALIILSFMIQPFFNQRYLSVAIFAYIILLVFSYKAIGDFILSRYRIAGVIAIALIISIQLSLSLLATWGRLNNGTFSSTFYQQVLEYIRDESEPDDTVVVTYGITVLNWYLHDTSLNLIQDKLSYIDMYYQDGAFPDERVWVSTTTDHHSSFYEIVQAQGIEPVYQYRTAVVYLFETE